MIKSILFLIQSSYINRMKLNKKNYRKFNLLCFCIGLSIGIGCGIYIWTLYQQLTVLFTNNAQFIPIKIYSDVTPITPQMKRSYITERIQKLGYLEGVDFFSSALEMQLKLHPIDYPTHLVPHESSMAPFIQKNEKETPIILQFNTHGNNALLQSIHFKHQEISDFYLEPELITLLSRTGDFKKEIRTYLKFEEIPATVWKAIIAVEDPHFLDHKGFDIRGIARAFWINLKTLSLSQGGSTITQQLIKNLMARKTKNIFKKINEMILSILLEMKFSKEKILERYINEVYLGQIGIFEIHGIAEGSEYFFGKKIDQLHLGEIALIAGIIRGPGFYAPFRHENRALSRQKFVLKKMVDTGYITQSEAEISLKLPMRFIPPNGSTAKDPFFTDYVKFELMQKVKNKLTEEELMRSGFKVYTTLDSYLNQKTQEMITKKITQLEKQIKLPEKNSLETALAAVDHTTGFIRVLIGGKNYSKSNFNRILNMQRQVGSTFKPVVYLTALEKKDAKGIPYGPGYPMEDQNWTLYFNEGKQSWTPQNFERNYQGWVSLRFALTHSINTVAAKLGNEVGIEAMIKTAHLLGVQSQLPQVPSLALGVANLSILELLQIYATLANRGVQNPLTSLRAITQADGTEWMRLMNNPQKVLDPAPIDLLTEMLQTVFTEGTAKNAKTMGFHHPAAGKSGTTSHHRDSWFAGYTPHLTAVTWVGLDHSDIPIPPTQLKHLTGAQVALPLWVLLMRTALIHTPLTPFPTSPLLTEVPIDKHTGAMAFPYCPPSQVILEKYIRGNEPNTYSCQSDWPASIPVVKE